MFVYVHLVQDDGWQLEGDAIAIYTNLFLIQQEQVGIISPSKRINITTQLWRLDAVDLTGGISNNKYQIKQDNTTPLINNLEI